eukprot:maker-scaffold695_size110128-snap-gene-0.19 protein:Tk05647 transcript:maker-scaffold695_size110128-snap-gene-0.19-mRNA-1 annotation:"unnamed protein product"
MSKQLYLVILALAASAWAEEKPTRYDGYQVLRVQVQDLDQLRVVQQIEKTELYDFWSNARIGLVDIMVSAQRTPYLSQELDHHKLEFHVMVQDVQELIDTEKMHLEQIRSNGKQGHNMDWVSYHSLAEIYEYLDYLEESFEDVSTEIIGQSYEGRDMRLISICRGGCGNKPAMWVDGGIHAREWISPATVTYLINQLVEELSADNQDLLDNLDWHILPVANPDGYEYTRASNRLWRKTRSEYDGNLCIGTDPNRNFGFHWNEGGSSDSSCSEAYHGPEAFSEIETANIRAWLLAHKENVKFYNNVHSYGQMILLPYGFAENVRPDVYDDLLALGNQAADTILAVNNKQFSVDLIPNLVGVASGGTVDWTLGVAGIKYSYGTELRDTGLYGFLLPPDQIIESGQEIWAMWQMAGRHIVTSTWAEEKPTRYDGYQVLRVQVQDLDQLRVVQQIEKTELYDFWSDARIGLVDIMVSAQRTPYLSRELDHHKLEFHVMVQDVQELIDTEKMHLEQIRSNGKQGHNMDWVSYHSLAEIYEYLDYLEESFEDVSTETIGQSYEGRDMRLISICRGGCGNKPAMWVDGGIHAREWISPATVTYLINQLVEELSADNQDLLDNLDWHILPVANPDGYEYTRASDRLWRKTRSEYAGNLCIGTDPNRNFGFHWNEGGSSDSSCSDAYHGPEAFSEIETANIRDWLLANKENVKLYNNVHSYSQFILLPYGYAENAKPDVYDDLVALGNQAAETIQAVNNKQFSVDLIPNLVGVASGGTVDWTLGVAGIKYSFAIELRDTGLYGFLLPPDQIIESGEEIWAMWQMVGRHIVDEFGN